MHVVLKTGAISHRQSIFDPVSLSVKVNLRNLQDKGKRMINARPIE